jgi:type VI secretion system protein ImpL
MLDLLAEAARHLPAVLAAVAALLLLAGLLLWALVRRASRAPWQAGGGGGVAGRLGQIAADLRAYPSSAALRRSFAAARRSLGRSAPGRGGLYALPWCLLLGQARAGKSTLAALNGLDLPFGEPPEAGGGGGAAADAGGGSGSPCRFWIYQQGVLLDLLGDLVLRRDGRTSDEDGWRAVLRLLRRERPRRPLDGVLLAIPAGALAGAAGGTTGAGVNGTTSAGGTAGTSGTTGASGTTSASGTGGAANGQDGERLNDAAQRAALLSRKLRQLQEAVGLRLPVHVVVTESDLLPGFSAFGELLPPAARGQLFGWSAPDSADTAYSPAWVDRLFDQLLATLDRDLAEMLGSRATTAGNEEAFQVARSIAALREPARIYLNQVFSASAFYEAFPFRGLYFTGASFAAPGSEGAAVVPRGAQPGPAGGAHGDERPSAIDFARDLLAGKLFAEAPLGRPTAAALRAARLRRLWLQAGLAAALLAAAFGLPAAGRATAALVRELLPFDQEIQRDLGAGEPRVPATRRLLAFARRLDDYTLRSALLPGSWLSPLDRDQRRAATRAYDRVVLPAVRTAVAGSLAGLGGGGAPPQTSDATPRPYAQTAEFLRFAGFTSDLGTGESQVAAFNCIAETCTGQSSRLVADLDGLTRWTYAETFQPPSWGAVRFYGAVLRGTDAAPIAYPPAGGDFGLHDRAAALDGAFLHRIFEHNAVIGDLDKLVAELRQLGRQRDVYDSAYPRGRDLGSLLELQRRPGAASYQRLLDQIGKTRRDLAAPEVAWMAAPALKLGSPYDQVIAAVHASRFLGPQAAADMTTAGTEGFSRMKSRLAAYESPYTGPLLAQQDGQVLLKLSPDVLQLEKALAGLLHQPFMTPVSWPSYPPGGQGVLLWDANLLQQAQAETLPLQGFLNQGLSLFPASLQPQVVRVAQFNTRDQMVAAIGRAEDWQPRPTWRVPELLQASLDRQVASFQTAAPLLGPLGASLAGLGFPGDAAQLAAQVDRERRGILEQLDVLLALLHLYSTADPSFSWWNGKPGLAYGAFEVADAAGLGAYLDTQRQAVTGMAERYASPVLAANGALPPLDGGVAVRWKTLLADLDAYKAKKAGNPLQALESLIAPTLAEVTVDSCLGQLVPGGPRPAADYFLGRRDELASRAHDRCLVLVSRDARKAYERLARSFNGSLAGRFPFSKDRPVRLQEQAEPPAIAGFYTAYDKAQGLIAQVPLDDPAFGRHGGEARKFMEQMKEVRKLLAPFLDTPEQYPVPTLGFSVQFRVNRDSEQAANEIFRWRLEVGGTALELGGATSTGRWSWGVPATLVLGWAEDSPRVPVKVADSLWGAVKGRAVTYQYDCPWGLLALLRDHPATAKDFQHPEDNRPETLKLAATTRYDPDLPVPQTEQALAFVQVTLTTPDGKTQLPLPQFPSAAPLLGE